MKRKCHDCFYSIIEDGDFLDCRKKDETWKQDLKEIENMHHQNGTMDKVFEGCSAEICRFYTVDKPSTDKFIIRERLKALIKDESLKKHL